MAELNLKQIVDKLNNEFNGDGRKLVFWYDAAGEFAEDIDALELINAKVYHLEKDNQFQTKYFLECGDTATNYLVYAPFAKPELRKNHLADTIRYSKEFFADRASLLTIDLGMSERCKPTVQRYIKFFAEKRRTQAFCDLGIDNYTPQNIEVGIMSVLCKSKTASFEGMMRTILAECEFENNGYLEEFKKYGLEDAFWKHTELVFGYTGEKPTLEKLLVSLFITYLAKYVEDSLPTPWQSFVSTKSGTVVAFLDDFMHHNVYGAKFDVLAKYVYGKLNHNNEICKLPLDLLVDCNIFREIDDLLVEWTTSRLEMEDVGAKLGDVNILQLLKKRRHGHFGKLYYSEYFVLENAWYLLSNSCYLVSKNLKELTENYMSTLYEMDRRYRYFYYHIDKVESDVFEKLKKLVENVYANDYLSRICVNWNDYFNEEISSLLLPKQVEFYDKFVRSSKEQLVVIISDALRYEVGKSLADKLEADEKCTVNMKAMFSTLPSITAYGMAALLPHKEISLTDDYSVLVDGCKVDSLKQREAVLQKSKLASRCVQFDDIKGLSVAELREIFTRQEVVYVYHNQIDARGDKLNTENEVFNACEEAIEEIALLIRRLTISANRSRFIVTSDHGFMYRRNKLTESDKLFSVAGSNSSVSRRYALSEKGVKLDGVRSTQLKVTFDNKDERMVSYPIGADIFKAAGSGINYVHGGCSPQEMLIPVLEVKTDRGYKETKVATLSMIGNTKITNLIANVDFMQREAIDDVTKEATYRIYFVDNSGEKISNEHVYIADKKETDSIKRMFTLHFMFKNQRYERYSKYYLLIVNDSNGLELLRQDFIIDIAFADDFGF